MEKKITSVYDEIESGDFNKPLSAFSVIGVSDMDSENLANALDRLVADPEFVSVEFYNENTFSFTYDEEVYYANLAVINTDVDDMILGSFISDDVRSKVSNVRESLIVQLTYGDDYMKSYRLHMKLCKLLVPSRLCIADLNARLIFSRKYCDMIIDCEYALDPATMFKIMLDEEQNRFVAYTRGLMRYGFFELKIYFDTESQGEIAYRIIEHLGIMLLYDAIKPVVRGSVSSFNNHKIAFETLEHYAVRNNISYSEDYHVEDRPIAVISLFDGNHYQNLDLEIFANQDVSCFIPEKELKRKSYFARATIQMLLDMYDGGEAEAAVKFNEEVREGELVEVWSDVKGIKNDVLKTRICELTSNNTKYKIGDKINISVEEIDDWIVNLEGEKIRPEDFYIYYQDGDEKVNPIILSNKNTFIKQVEIWKKEGRYYLIKEALEEKKPLSYEYKFIYLDALINLNLYDEALVVISMMFFEGKSDYNYLSKTAFLMDEIYEEDAALTLIDKAIAINGDNLDYKVLKAKLLLAKKNIGDAEKLLKEIKHSVSLGAHLSKQSSDIVDDTFDKMLKHKYKKSSEDLLPKLRLLFFNENYSEVVKIVDEKYSGQNKHVVLIYIKSLIKLAKFKRAKTELDRLEEIAENDTDWHSMYVEVARGLGDDEAERYHQEKLMELSEWYLEDKLKTIEQKHIEMYENDKFVDIFYYDVENVIVILFEPESELITNQIKALRDEEKDIYIYRKVLEKLIVNFYTNFGKTKIETVDVKDFPVIAIEFKDSYKGNESLFNYLLEKTIELNVKVLSSGFKTFYDEFNEGIVFEQIDTTKVFDFSNKQEIYEFNMCIKDLIAAGAEKKARQLYENQAIIKEFNNQVAGQVSNIPVEKVQEFLPLHLIYIKLLNRCGGDALNKSVAYIDELKKYALDDLDLMDSLDSKALYAKIINPQTDLFKLEDDVLNIDVQIEDMDVENKNLVICYILAESGEKEAALQYLRAIPLDDIKLNHLFNYLVRKFKYLRSESDVLFILDKIMSIDVVEDKQFLKTLIKRIESEKNETLKYMVVRKLIDIKQYDMALNFCEKTKFDEKDLKWIIIKFYLNICLSNFSKAEQDMDYIYSNIDAVLLMSKSNNVVNVISFAYILTKKGEYLKAKHLLMWVPKETILYQEIADEIYQKSSIVISENDYEEYFDFLKTIGVKEEILVS